MVEISEGLGVAKGALTKTVDRPEERGLLVRVRDPGDRRTSMPPCQHSLHSQRSVSAGAEA